MTPIKKLPRGIRNNNPLNIRISNNRWLGKVAGVDKQFETFSSPEFGIRAAFCIVRTYITRYNVRSVHDLIARYAPASENDVEAYTNQVLRLSNTYRTEILYFHRRLQMSTILWAMHVVECGKSYFSLQVFTNVYDKYFYQKPQ